MELLKSEIPFTIRDNEIDQGPFPANGFLPLFETDFGNGDYYGLYWPIGLEKEPPIVCELFHDEWRLAPACSNALILAESLELDNDYQDDNLTFDDPLFAVNLFKQSQYFRKEHNVEDAIHYCQMACNSFSESSEYWLTLAGLYQQSNNRLLSIKAALNSYLSNWGFGVPHDKVLYFLKQGMDFSELCSDPVIQKIADGELNLNFGGAKTNNNYPLMKECINAYFSLNQTVSALKLYQNYAFTMYTETSAFQERYDFCIEEWRSDFKALCLKHLNDSRSKVTIK